MDTETPELSDDGLRFAGLLPLVASSMLLLLVVARFSAILPSCHHAISERAVCLHSSHPGIDKSHSSRCHLCFSAGELDAKFFPLCSKTWAEHDRGSARHTKPLRDLSR